jgi:acetyl esterase/lipase
LARVVQDCFIALLRIEDVMKSRFSLIVLMFMVFPGWNSLQASDSLEGARAVVQELGKAATGAVNAPTMAAYITLHREADQSGVRLIPDISYGEHPRHLLDLVVPESGTPEKAPVVVYIHGGGLVAGDRIAARSEGYLYTNIPTYFARQGMIGINATYRLVPEVSWPSGPEDLRLILEWIQKEVPAYGGDPDKVFFVCNSAGCNHVASYLF